MVNIIRDLFLIAIGSLIIGMEVGWQIGCAVFILATGINDSTKYNRYPR